MMHKYKIKRWLTLGMSVAFAIGLNGCSEDTTSGSTTTSTTPTAAAVYTGVLVDGPVSGVSYHSPAHSGKTDADGKFNYTDGEDVVFDFGKVKLGGARGKGVITPMDLMSADSDNDLVMMMASLLQSLDKDGQHGNGIQLNDTIAALLEKGLSSGDYSSLLNVDGVIDFEALAKTLASAPAEDVAAITAALKGKLQDLLVAVVAEAANDGDPETTLAYVPLDQAIINLAAATEDSVIFRKNISKTPLSPSAKSKLNIMMVYVEAQKADDTQVEKVDGECVAGQMIEGKGDTCWAKPLVAAYTDVDKRTPDAAPDAFMAISRDDGATWKRFNLSRTGDKDVSVSGLLPEPKGASKKPVFQAKGDKIIVAWTDKYCKGGKPKYSVLELDAEGNPVDADGDLKNDKLYDDFYGVAGSQDFIDYTAVTPEIDPARMPIPSSVAYSCLWSARTTVKAWSKVGDPDDLQVYKAERITSGTRDAYQVFVGGASKAGFAITWQEDPEGLRPGSGDGPGHGFSGATTNHKTDVWYSYIKWDDFNAIDAEDVAGSDDPDATPVIADELYDDTRENARVRALNHMSMPIRVTDNNMCNIENIGTNGHEYCRLKADGTLATWDGLNPDGASLHPGDEILATMINCSSFLDVPTSSGTQTVCVTNKGSILDGDTGASRPNLFLQPYTKSDGVTVSAWAIMGYEETKGVGVGPDNELITSDDPEEVGKDVFYHSFEFSNPGSDVSQHEQLAAGDRLNLPELENNDGTPGDPIILTMADGTVRYATENARRVRFILQGKKPSLGKDTNGDGIGDTGAGVPLIAIYKQGPLGKGRPSDIMLRRLSVRNADDSVKKGNPYMYSNFLCDTWLDEETVALDPETSVTLPATCNAKGANGAQNMSSVTPGITADAGGGGSVDTTPYEKLITWTVEPANLLNESWQTPMTESRAHRGQIRGDFVVMGYVQTPNWAAARIGNDKYDFYVRRSFDAGATWTTDPNGDGVKSCWWQRTDPDLTVDDKAEIKCETFAAGAFERPRNVSLLKNAKESVIEPRIVAVPGTINACNSAPCVGVTNPKEDVQNKAAFITSYGLAANENPDEAAPTDMYYARSMDFGESYSTVPHNQWVDDGGVEPLQVFDWMAMRKDVEEGEAQLRITPDGSKAYTTYLSESNSDYSGPEHFSGSDIWFRKFSEADFNPLEETEETQE